MKACKLRKLIQEFAIGFLFGLLGYLLLAVQQESWSFSKDIIWLAGLSLGPALIFGLLSLAQPCEAEAGNMNYVRTVGGSRKGKFWLGLFFGSVFGFISYFLYATLQEMIFSIVEALAISLLGGLALGFILALDKGITVKESESVAIQYLGLFGQESYGKETFADANQIAYLPLVFGILSIVFALQFEKYSFASLIAVLGGFRYGIKILNLKTGFSVSNLTAIFGIVLSLFGLWLVLK